MRVCNVREKLIENTIRVIAQEGLDKTTTKKIVSNTDINEAYIYTYFESKEDLFTKVFEYLDAGLAKELDLRLPILCAKDIDFEMRHRMFFTAIWDFMMKNRENCITFVRYYYSAYFLKYSVTSHKKRYEPIVEKFNAVFIDEADVWMILNHMLNVILDFAIMVHGGQMSNEDDYVEHVFRVIYCSIEQYFKKEVKEND